MGADPQVHELLDLMHEYVASAELNLAHGHFAPVHNHAIHALELGLKACIRSAGGRPDRTHHIGGEFGRKFGEIVAKERLRRVNRILDGCNAARCPGHRMPDPGEVTEDSPFILEFLRKDVSRIVERVTS